MKAIVILFVFTSNFCFNWSFYHGSNAFQKRRAVVTYYALKEGKNNAFSSWKNKIPTEESNIGTVSEIPIKESIIDNKESNKIPDITVNEVIKANNPIKDRLLEEITKEDLRTTQLESLLEAFQSAVSEKEQLITLESSILEQMNDIRSKISDVKILQELDTTTLLKIQFIKNEQEIYTDISDVTKKLSKEVHETREKIINLQQFINEDKKEFQVELKASIESSRTRDEKVLALINIFDAATSKGNLDPVPGGMEGSEQGGESMDIQLETSDMNKLAIDIEKRQLQALSNPDLAASAGKIVGDTAGALVAVTSSLITAGADFVGSSEARDSSESIRLASKSIVVMGSNIKEAWIAATIAYNNDDGNNLTGYKKLIDGINQVLSSEGVKGAIDLLGENAGKSISEAAKAAELASNQLGSNLKNSKKW
eukprot:CAMPEP_0119051246 /NCGR_PEP_ID=MMETSP1177-20130426/72924_1 /TAXON_ID=2985 /ORGANISM="Ochromonas sp, Strain CCMP1899" /LENGTH=425 /DNA_ID=CAMNT_0007030381 /DNA_START=177 /DNA_END=1451 /DNA_ORIENTATION=-